MRSVEQIVVDYDTDENINKVIKKAERKKAHLENLGYTLIGTECRQPNKWILTYNLKR